MWVWRSRSPAQRLAMGSRALAERASLGAGCSRDCFAASLMPIPAPGIAGISQQAASNFVTLHTTATLFQLGQRRRSRSGTTAIGCCFVTDEANRRRMAVVPTRDRRRWPTRAAQ
jgi:hypothetical protein